MIVVWPGDLFSTLFSVLRSLSGKYPAPDAPCPSAIDEGDPIAGSHGEGPPSEMATPGRGDGVGTTDRG